MQGAFTGSVIPPFALQNPCFSATAVWASPRRVIVVRSPKTTHPETLHSRVLVQVPKSKPLHVPGLAMVALMAMLFQSLALKFPGNQGPLKQPPGDLRPTHLCSGTRTTGTLNSGLNQSSLLRDPESVQNQSATPKAQGPAGVPCRRVTCSCMEGGRPPELNTSRQTMRIRA